MSGGTVINWIMVNLPFIIFLILFVIFAFRAVKAGFVKELCEFISAIIASIAIIRLAYAIYEVFDKEKIQFAVVVILIVLLGIVYKLLSLCFTSLKLIAKLPVVKVLDKILGVVMALLEIVVLIWAVYSLIIIVKGGALGRWIIECAKQNPIMRFLYERNYLFILIRNIGDKLSMIDFLQELES